MTKRPTKTCLQCGRRFEKPPSWSRSAWEAVSRCSQTCRGNAIRGRVHKTMAQRFAEHITYEPNSGCWLWTAALSSYGYAATLIAQRQLLVHRVMFEQVYGAVPAGHILCHRCNVRSCVNPDHVYIGTALTNAQDAVRARRHTHGEMSGRAKLTDSAVSKMRTLHASGVRISVIAERFGVSRPTAAKACKGSSWKHVL